HAQAAAEVQVANRDALDGELVHQRHDAAEGILERAEAGELAADVAVHAENLDMRQVGGALVQRRRVVDVDAELVVFQAGGNVGVRLCVHVRVHANRNRRHHRLFTGDQIQQFQFGGGFHIEAVDAGFQR